MLPGRRPAGYNAAVDDDTDERFDVKFHAAGHGTIGRPASVAVMSPVIVILTALGIGCHRATSPPPRSVAAETALPATFSVQPRPADDSLTGRELYLNHCGPCHGADGGGRGEGARSLFPRPHNFRSSKFRLVSTVNGVPSRADLGAVLVRGVPGASMPSFRPFAEATRGRLIDEVLRFRREGLQAALAFKLGDAHQEDEIATEELREILDLQLTPGAPVAVPKWGPATEALVRRGGEIYIQQQCARCHGPDGRGDTGLYLANEEGYPTRPRNLVWEEFKGGTDPPSIFVRIRLGLPGTPMVANPNLSEQELAALVHHVRSLAREPKWPLTNYQRAKLVLDRGFLSPGHPQ